ncbi:MAG: hypothetical protein JXB32_10525 [Deltaproteobacteria bacterium]|nr:hypothetical protein [Deltaproteobacteria bacterium]
MKTSLIGCLVWLAPLAAAAEPVVHGGVAVDELTPAEMQRLSVTAPTEAGRPVRLVYGRGTTPELLVDVRVAADADGARAALAARLRTVTSPPPEAALGDAGLGDAGFAAFVRDNVFVSVHRVAGEADALAAARAMDAVVVAAPEGSPALEPGGRRWYDDAQLGERPLPVEFPQGLLAAQLEVCGPAYARRTGDGWVVVRTGPGTVTVRVLGVDRLLRTAAE